MTNPEIADWIEARCDRNRSNGCIEWRLFTTKHSGHGKNTQLKAMTGTEYVHRAYWLVTRGPIPTGLEVRHTCNNPKCVNPDHLVLGTHRQNMEDLGRSRKISGANGSGAILTEEQAQEILDRTLAGESMALLAEEFGVTYTAVRFIKNRKTWKHLVRC